jgi:hypothetical protein
MYSGAMTATSGGQYSATHDTVTTKPVVVFYLSTVNEAHRDIPFVRGAQASSTDDTRWIKRRFEELAQEWHGDTIFLSSLTAVVTHPAYLSIIAMGPAVVPFILNELRDNPGMWFTALKAITGCDPVAKQDIGNFQNMRNAWLAWGQLHGHIV